MKTFFASVLAAGAIVVSNWLPADASAQGVVLMPDSTNNRLVAFDPFNGSVVSSSLFTLGAGTPISAIQVGDEIWVSEQIGDRISRWSMSGVFLGQISGGLDNVRGITLLGDVVYVANSGTNNGAPGPAVVMYSTAGVAMGSFSTAGLAPGPFYVFGHQGGLLVSSDTGNSDIHRFTTDGMSLGAFHNSASLNFVEQLTLASNGSVLAAGFSTNNVAFLDPTTGTLLNSFAASGARGVFQLGNGNILWTSGTGAFSYDPTTNTSTLLYSGGGRFLSLAPVPEPSSVITFGMGVLLLAICRRFAKR